MANSKPTISAQDVVQGRSSGSCVPSDKLELLGRTTARHLSEANCQEVGLLCIVSKSQEVGLPCIVSKTTSMALYQNLDNFLSPIAMLRTRKDFQMYELICDIV